MALPTQPVKGARDFYPEQMRLQKYIFAKWREACEKFGFEEYDAPILEPTELYLAKGNEEIVNEQTYTFVDRGDRSLTIRTEMTPSVSRMVAAKRQELNFPLKWYSIPQCWRYERTQRGRGREFYQLNADIFGAEGLEADFEIIQLADSIMQSFGAKRGRYEIRLNSRKLTDTIFQDVVGLDDTQAESMRRLVDKLSKLKPEEFDAKLSMILTPSQRETGLDKEILKLLKITSFEELAPELQTIPYAKELKKLIDMLEYAGITNVIYDPSLMRGFEYYTGISFEVFDKDPDNNRSMFGGGRFDSLVAQFGVDPVPTVGFGMGDITLRNFLEANELIPKLKPEADLYVILVGDVFEKAEKAISELRRLGVNVFVDNSGRKLDKQIKTADKQGLQYALFIGEQELTAEQFKLKDLKTGNEESKSLERIASIVKDYRSK